MIVFAWFIFGIAAAAVAYSKNRGFFSWLFLGLLLGPIALIMVGFMPRLADPNPRTRRCPHCAEYVMPQALVCKHCGRDLPPLEATEPTRKPPVAEIVFGLVLLCLVSGLATVGYYVYPEMPSPSEPTQKPAQTTPSPPESPWFKVSSLEVNGRTINMNTKMDDVLAFVPKESMKTVSVRPDPSIEGSHIIEKTFPFGNGNEAKLVLGRWDSVNGTYRVRAIFVLR